MVILLNIRRIDLFTKELCDSNPFRPPELSKRSISNKGAPPKATAKPRKPSRILQTLQSNSRNEADSFASEKRNTKRTRKNIRITKVSYFII